ASVHPLPRQIPRLASLEESGDAPRGIALEEVTKARLARDEEDVGRFEAKRLRRLSRRSAGQPVRLTTDDEGEIAERISTAVGAALIAGGGERGGIAPQRQDLHREQLPLAIAAHPGLSHAVASVDLCTVEGLVLVGEVGGERDVAEHRGLEVDGPERSADSGG